MFYPELPKIARIAIIIAVVGGSVVIVGHGMVGGRSGVSDFAGYYTASHVIAQGDSVALMYNDDWFIRRVKALGMTDTSMIMYVNPPCVALIMTPLIGLPPVPAKLLWNCFNLFLLVIVWLLGRRVFEIPKHSSYELLFAGMVLATIPLLRNLQRGQVYVAMLLLVLLLYQGLRARNAWLAGISLAVLLLLKYFGWMFLLLFVVIRRWKEFLITIAFVGIVSTVMTVSFGMGLYEAHFQRLISSFSSFDVAITHLPSLPAFFGGLFVYHPLYNPSPIANLPIVALGLTLAALIIMAALSIRSFLRNTSGALPQSFFALLVLSVIFTPLGAEHHFLLLVPAFWYHCFSGGLRLDTGSLVFYALLSYSILGWFPGYREPYHSWFSQLSAYPHLYGAMVLWGALISTPPFVSRDPENKRYS